MDLAQSLEVDRVGWLEDLEPDGVEVRVNIDRA
jgi:hypothetical protein